MCACLPLHLVELRSFVMWLEGMTLQQLRRLRQTPVVRGRRSSTNRGQSKRKVVPCKLHYAVLDANEPEPNVAVRGCAAIPTSLALEKEPASGDGARRL